MNHAFDLVASYGYIIVFLAVFLDQAIISVPSPPLIAAIGVLSASGRFNLWFALLIVFGAACLADSLWYAMGKSQRNRLTAKLVPKQLSAKAAPIARFLARGMLGGLLAVKFSLFPSSIVPFFAGSTRFSLGRFLLFQALANLLWGSIFLFGGFLSAHRSLQGLGKFMSLLSIH
jgi:membrane protein DedA with SNARE-associated domain